MQDEIHNFPEQNSSNKPIAELTDCYQPSLCEGEIMKKKKKRKRKEGGWRERRERREREEGKGGAARETKSAICDIGNI